MAEGLVRHRKHGYHPKKKHTGHFEQHIYHKRDNALSGVAFVPYIGCRMFVRSADLPKPDLR
jgi:hypothetical protein